MKRSQHPRLLSVFDYENYAGRKAEGRFIKFQQRRLDSKTWGQFVVFNFSALESYEQLKCPCLELIGENTFNVADREKYLAQVIVTNKNRSSDGLDKIEPLDYFEEVCDVQRVIIAWTFLELKKFYGPFNSDIGVKTILRSHEKKCRDFLNQIGVDSSSNSNVSFEVMCIDPAGYEGKFVNGGSYMAFQKSDDMISVVSEDGSEHLMFEDRFVRV